MSGYFRYMRNVGNIQASLNSATMRENALDSKKKRLERKLGELQAQEHRESPAIQQATPTQGQGEQKTVDGQKKKQNDIAMEIERLKKDQELLTQEIKELNEHAAFIGAAAVLAFVRDRDVQLLKSGISPEDIEKVNVAMVKIESKNSPPLDESTKKAIVALASEVREKLDPAGKPGESSSKDAAQQSPVWTNPAAKAALNLMTRYAGEDKGVLGMAKKVKELTQTIAGIKGREEARAGKESLRKAIIAAMVGHIYLAADLEILLRKEKLFQAKFDPSPHLRAIRALMNEIKEKTSLDEGRRGRRSFENALLAGVHFTEEMPKGGWTVESLRKAFLEEVGTQDPWYQSIERDFNADKGTSRLEDAIEIFIERQDGVRVAWDYDRIRWKMIRNYDLINDGFREKGEALSPENNIKANDLCHVMYAVLMQRWRWNTIDKFDIDKGAFFALSDHWDDLDEQELKRRFIIAEAVAEVALGISGTVIQKGTGGGKSVIELLGTEVSRIVGGRENAVTTMITPTDNYVSEFMRDVSNFWGQEAMLRNWWGTDAKRRTNFFAVQGDKVFRYVGTRDLIDRQKADKRIAEHLWGWEEVSMDKDPGARTAIKDVDWKALNADVVILSGRSAGEMYSNKESKGFEFLDSMKQGKNQIIVDDFQEFTRGSAPVQGGRNEAMMYEDLGNGHLVTALNGAAEVACTAKLGASVELVGNYLSRPSEAASSDIHKIVSHVGADRFIFVSATPATPDRPTLNEWGLADSDIKFFGKKPEVERKQVEFSLGRNDDILERAIHNVDDSLKSHQVAVDQLVHSVQVGVVAVDRVDNAKYVEARFIENHAQDAFYHVIRIESYDNKADEMEKARERIAIILQGGFITREMFARSALTKGEQKMTWEQFYHLAYHEGLVDYRRDADNFPLTDAEGEILDLVVNVYAFKKSNEERFSRPDIVSLLKESFNQKAIVIVSKFDGGSNLLGFDGMAENSRVENRFAATIHHVGRLEDSTFYLQLAGTLDAFNTETNRAYLDGGKVHVYVDQDRFNPTERMRIASEGDKVSIPAQAWGEHKAIFEVMDSKGFLLKTGTEKSSDYCLMHDLDYIGRQLDSLSSADIGVTVDPKKIHSAKEFLKAAQQARLQQTMWGLAQERDVRQGRDAAADAEYGE